jgi:hypothetical protein
MGTEQQCEKFYDDPERRASWEKESIDEHNRAEAMRGALEDIASADETSTLAGAVAIAIAALDRDDIRCAKMGSPR